VLPLEERDQDNRGADVRDDEDQFQQRPEVMRLSAPLPAM
jgi:hypothetical protein